MTYLDVELSRLVAHHAAEASSHRQDRAARATAVAAWGLLIVSLLVAVLR